MDADGHIRLQTVFQGTIALIAVGFLLQITSAFTIPFVIAALLVVALAPIQDWLEARRVPRGLASTIVLLGLFLVVFGLGVLVYDSVRSVTRGIHDYVEGGKELLLRLDALAVERFGVSLRDEFAQGESGSSLADLFSQGGVIEAINSSLGSFMGFFSGLLLTVLFLLFILGSRGLMMEKLRHFFADRDFDEADTQEIIKTVTQQVQAYLVLKTLISLGTGAAVWVVAYAFGLDFPIVWGFLTFLLNYIPSIGPIIASAPPIAIAFLQFESPWTALLVSVLILVVQFVSGNVIEPKIMGDRLNLNIVVVLMSLFVWGLVWGFAGMVLSVPLTACVNIVLANTRRFKNISVWLSG